MSDIRDDYLKFRVDDDQQSGSFMSSAIKILVIILLLLLMVVLGAVAYKFLFKDEKATIQSQPIQKTPMQNSDGNNLVQNVTDAVESRGGGVKKEEIALIVKSVLAQMNQAKQQKAASSASEPAQNNAQMLMQEGETVQGETQPVQEGDDAALLNDLSTADVDNVQEQEMDLSSLDNIDSNKEVKEKNVKADTFNKVIIDKNEVATKDDLSKLYAKLNQIMKKDKKKVQSSNYVSKIKKETKVRSNAMRIITVRKGDTLSLIARRAYGDAMMYPKIFAANPDLIKNPNMIFPGQKLRVPK